MEQETLTEMAVITEREHYEFAVKMMVEDEMGTYVTKKALIERGLDHDHAQTIVTTIHEKMNAIERKSGNKDMLFGGLWFVGGLIATLANIGYIFWGAMVFGAIQFIRGAMASSGD